MLQEGWEEAAWAEGTPGVREEGCLGDRKEHAPVSGHGSVLAGKPACGIGSWWQYGQSWDVCCYLYQCRQLEQVTLHVKACPY
jgi:hypothetical protein